jgi:hypothetical protein
VIVRVWGLDPLTPCGVATDPKVIPEAKTGVAIGNDTASMTNIRTTGNMIFQILFLPNLVISLTVLFIDGLLNPSLVKRPFNLVTISFSPFLFP